MTTADTPFALARGPMPPAMRILCALLSRIERGRIELTTPDGCTRVYGPGGASVRDGKANAAILNILDWNVAAAALKGGDVGFAEAFIKGAWTTPDLPHLLTTLAANQPALERAFYGKWWARWALWLRHRRRDNTKANARRNIVAHYDLGNAFYAQWLDPSMTYSSALFGGRRDLSLAAAQQAKYDRVLAELDLHQPSRILEIGCGWGGFAQTAADAGHEVVGISLSNAQTVYARDRLAAAGLFHRVDIRLQDYRDVNETFDAVASIEMVEAVGERYWPAYFRAVRNALVQGGHACIQAITIADERFERYRTQSDFIQQYIFPGGMLPTPSRLAAQAKSAGLDLVRTHRFGHDYAATLVRWLAAFDAALPQIRQQGFDERFIRCWRFYLAYCVAGFATETTDVAQYTFVRA